MAREGYGTYEAEDEAEEAGHHLDPVDPLTRARAEGLSAPLESLRCAERRRLTCQLSFCATQAAQSGPVALAVKTVRTKVPIAGPRTLLGNRSATTPAATGPCEVRDGRGRDGQLKRAPCEMKMVAAHLNAGHGALEEAREDDRRDVGRERLGQEQEADAARASERSTRASAEAIECPEAAVVTHRKVRMTSIGRRPNVSAGAARAAGQQ